ncbi:polyketide cyclase/dehydrase [Natronococcus sp. JC468]|uniref:polyketide cyclase/dehydrase n=1 Tax=Natronococcus sp. JC468 TaxID=1961921 RepID=UPI00143BCC05|nr:polyketide cyclase/dehydrase [Natronococcus sp. JC468]NKE34912.1 polyketide cyclase/dehydrase [Natronococcus sp. JC468]
MNQVERFEEVDAPPETVWNVLLELEDELRRTALSRSLEAVPVVGDRLGADRVPTGIGRAVFEPEVRIAEENRRLVRLERIGVPYALDSYHEFHLEPIDGGRRTRLLQRETARGALVPVLFDERRLGREFEDRNRLIRERSEPRTRA